MKKKQVKEIVLDLRNNNRYLNTRLGINTEKPNKNYQSRFPNNIHFKTNCWPTYVNHCINFGNNDKKLFLV